MLGKYLDALPNVALERIRTATGWLTHGYVDSTSKRCILGHAEDWYIGEDGETHCGAPELVELRTAANDHLYNWPPLIGSRFDRLVERRGLDNVVSLVKRRAVRARAGRNAAITRRRTRETVFVRMPRT